LMTTPRALFSTPVTPVSNKNGFREEEESPSFDGSSFSESLVGLSQNWRTRVRMARQVDDVSSAGLVQELQGTGNRFDAEKSGAKRNRAVASLRFAFPVTEPVFLGCESSLDCISVFSALLTTLFSPLCPLACYKLLKEERRINNDYHKRVHGSPSEWGKLVSKRLMELHPLYSPSKKDKRARLDEMPLELDDVENMLRDEVLLQLQGKQQLCACGQMIEPGDMFNAHVLPCPHCGSQKCSECTATALEVRATSSCCEACAMACTACVRKLRLACSSCHLGRRCQGAGCGGVRCSTCFNQLCEDCKELDGTNSPPGEDGQEGTGFEYFFCQVCQFRSCQDCQRKNCYCAPATRLRVPDAIPTKVEGRSMSHLFDVLGGKGGKHARK
jgi:hypothetical protein